MITTGKFCCNVLVKIYTQAAFCTVTDDAAKLFLLGQELK